MARCNMTKTSLKCELCGEDVCMDTDDIWCACHIQPSIECVTGTKPSYWYMRREGKEVMSNLSIDNGLDSFICPICNKLYYGSDCLHRFNEVMLYQAAEITRLRGVLSEYAAVENWSPLDEHGMNPSEWLPEQEGWLRAEEALRGDK